MLQVIEVWAVRAKSPHGGEDETFRVPQTELDAFLQVLTFNAREFSVAREKLPEFNQAVMLAGPQQKLP